MHHPSHLTWVLRKHDFTAGGAKINKTGWTNQGYHACFPCQMEGREKLSSLNRFLILIKIDDLNQNG